LTFSKKNAGRFRPAVTKFIRVDQFQKGLLSPAGAIALSALASVPDSSEIFSSMNRDGGVFTSSFLPGVGSKGYSDFM